MSVGILSAERDGPHVKLTIEYTDPAYDHFMVERFDGYRVDDVGNRHEVWTPIHSGQAKYVCGGVTKERSTEWSFDEDDNESLTPLPGPRTYRALVFRRVQDPGTQVRVLATSGTYSNQVTI